MVRTAILGYPRIGARRELKRLQESWWKGELDAAAFEAGCAELRLRHHRQLAAAGLDVIPSGEACHYDQVLDATLMLGAIPPRFGWDGTAGDPELGCRLARGQAPGEFGTAGVPALAMTKWFDTNYHYLVPELAAELPLRYVDDAIVRRYAAARSAGIETRPVLIGPITWLRLGRAVEPGFDPLSLLPRILPIYRQVLADLAAAGAMAVQLDEPVLATDLAPTWRAALVTAYGELSAAELPAITLASYFGPLGANADAALAVPVAELHVDAVRGGDELVAVAGRLRAEQRLSIGIVDGRNVWTTDLTAALARLEPLREMLGSERLSVATSCSLQHVPVSLAPEDALDPELRSWLAFADEKVAEVVTLGRALRGEDVAAALATNAAALASRRASDRVRRPVVQARMAAANVGEERRASSYAERTPLQAAALDLPLLPTTTIGSFPQTDEIRRARAQHRRGEIDDAAYRGFLEDEIRGCIARQEAIGLDLLVHGEAERTDMVEHFGEHLSGFATTRFGWVLSYGSRCVKPPLIYGDLARERPMTIDWARFAQACSAKPVKGMLTGPVTILQWSFVRDDQPRSDTCRQIAYAIRDEVVDLEAAGIRAIQIDEPAIREGLPLRVAEHAAYLDWAVRAFRVATSGVTDATQIHTHMCYSDFNGIIAHIAELDADVISIECSRARMELLGAFRDFAYPNEVGPGVYDIHSPRVPSVDEMVDLLERAAALIDPARLWVNPDCGLKTRAWAEVEPALRNMVTAARQVRDALAEPAGSW